MSIGDFFTIYRKAYHRELDNVARLEARVEMLEEERRELMVQLREEHAAHIETHRRFTDFLGKRSGVGTVFGPYEAVPDIPPMEIPDMASRITGREYREQGRADFIAALERKINESVTKPNA